MAPIALGPKHQDLLKAYIQVSKTNGVDWAAIATKADYPTSKYARDQWALVKSKLLATDNGSPIGLSDRQIALLKATLEVMKTETDWEQVAEVGNIKTSKYARDQFAIVRTRLCGGGKAKADTASPSKTPSKTSTKTKASKVTASRKRKNPEPNNDDDDDGGASQPLASADEASTPKAKKNRKSRKVKVEAEETEVEDEHGDFGEPVVAPAVQEKPAEALEDEKLELEEEQQENFFETEMFFMG